MWNGEDHVFCPLCKLLFRILYLYVVYYVRKYCKVLKVRTLITFGFSSLFPIAIFEGLLLSGIAFKMCTADIEVALIILHKIQNIHTFYLENLFQCYCFFKKKNFKNCLIMVWVFTDKKKSLKIKCNVL